MLNNGLYHFLLDNSSVTPEGCTAIKLLETKKTNRSYVVLELPCTAKSPLLLDYTLTSHHLSVYNQQSKHNARLSNYHYTGYFNNDNDTYRLHVYFDENDQQQEIHLEKEEDGVYETISLNANQCAACAIYATTHSWNVITKIRAKHKTSWEILTQEKNKRGEELEELSKDLIQNHNSYLEKLITHIKKLKPLVRYSYQTSLTGEMKVMGKIRDFLQSIPKKTILGKPTPKAIIPDVTNDDAISTTASPTKITLKPREKTARETLMDDIIANAESFDAIDKTTSTKEQTDIIYHYHRAVLDAELQIDDVRFTLDDLIILQKHKKISDTACNKQLKALLFSNELDLALMLKSFTDTLDPRLFQMSLMQNNPQLANFLLTHGTSTSINSTTFSLKNVGELLPAAYCYERKDKDYTEFLKVLIAHGSSLTVPGKDGLPIAHHILSEYEHPLQKALFDTKIIHDKNFHHSLIAALTQSQHHDQQDEKTLQAIDKTIQICYITLKGLSGASLEDTSQKTFIQLLDPEVRKIFYHDTDIINAYQKLQDTQLTLQGLHRNKARKTHQAIPIEKSKAPLPSDVKDFFQTRKINTIKKDGLQALGIYNDMLLLQIELFPIQTQLKKAVHQTRGKPTSTQKRLLKQQGEILKKVDFLIKDNYALLKEFIGECSPVEIGLKKIISALDMMNANIAAIEAAQKEILEYLEKKSDPLQETTPEELRNKITQFKDQLTKLAL